MYMLLNDKCLGTFKNHKNNILIMYTTPIKMEHNVLKLNIKIAHFFSSVSPWHM